QSRPQAAVAPDPVAPEPVAPEPGEFTALRSAPTRPGAPPKPKRHRLLQTYREWEPGTDGDISVLDELPGRWAKQQVRAVIGEVIAAEGPVQADRLAKLVAGAFGLDRVSAGRRRSIQQVVPS